MKNSPTSPSPAIAGSPHVWMKLRLGRTCRMCQRQQRNAEFKDIDDCAGVGQPARKVSPAPRKQVRERTARVS